METTFLKSNNQRAILLSEWKIKRGKHWNHISKLILALKICTPHPYNFRRPCRLERQNPWLLSVNGVATQALSFFASANGRKPNFPHVHQYHERTWNGSDQKRWFWFPFCVSYIAPVKRSFTASQCSLSAVLCSLVQLESSAEHCSAVAVWQLPIILICFVLLRFPSSRRFNRCGSHHYCTSAHQYEAQWAAAAALRHATPSPPPLHY